MISVDSDHILIQRKGTHECKSIPNGRKVAAGWVYPKTPTVAFLIKQAWPLEVPKHPIFMEYSKGPVVKESNCDLKTKLWNHQKDAIGLTTIRRGCLLNIGMGGGKSLATIATLNLHVSSKCLIICPKSVVGVWPKQFATHSRRRYRVARLDQSSTTKKLDTLQAALESKSKVPLVVIVNYDSVWRNGLAVELLKVDFDTLILDESHRIKSFKGRASKFCAELSRKIPRRIGLTGTPMPHSPVDLFAQFRAIDVDLFGPYITPFKERYTIKGGFQNKEIVGFQNQDDLRDKFNMLTYTITAKEALPDLPDTLDIDIDIDMAPKGYKIYKELERNFIVWLDETDEAVVAKNALGKLLRLQQMTGGYARTEDGKDVQVDTSKIDALKDILADHGDQKVVVFCRFKADLKLVRDLCDGLKIKWAELSGARHELTRDATIPDDVEVMITQVQSGSVGVDFSSASIAVNYSLGFSLGEYMQSRSRLHRPGQKKCVAFYNLKCKSTVDFKIYKAFKQKQDVIDLILKEGYQDETG